MIPNMSDENVHTVYIEYNPGILRIFLDDLQNVALEIPINLATTLALENGQAFVGFTSATAGAQENHSILSWSLDQN